MTAASAVNYLFICPTYGNYCYSRAAVESFLTHTPAGLALVVDDGHEKFHKFWDDEWNVIAHHFETQAGLTRSWNFGLHRAKEIGVKYAICGNDDILFTPEWYVGPEALLEDDSVAIVGALSNGPGTSNELQNVWDHVPNYIVSDQPEQINAVAASLQHRYSLRQHLKTHEVNGFFMLSRTSRWWDGRFDENHVFDPDPQFSLQASERELQNRFRRRGWRNVISLTTFIFHYRSVTRGDAFNQGMWCRRTA